MSGKSEKKEHQKKIIGLSRKGLILTVIAAVAVGASITIGLNRVYMQSSTDESCQSCHVHPQADKSWKLSSHHNSKSGVVTGCAECHLPPKGSFKHFTAKARTGLKDLWAYWTKDSSEFDWESKKELDHAVTIVYNESCKECHQQLFPSRLSQEGITAHLYYEENEKKLDLQCISCHLDVGHYDPNYTHAKMQGIPQPEAKKGEPFTEAATVTAFENFTETIPGTTVSFDMKAIPGGTFAMGSPDDEPFRRDDEGPVKKVTVSPFFIGETEVTWDQYWAFYAETMSEGRTPPEKVYQTLILNDEANIVAITEEIQAFCRRNGIDEKKQYYILLCLEEIAVNIIHYGFRDGREHYIDIRIVAGGNVLLNIRDDAIQFDPTAKVEADVTSSAEERDIGGLGIYLVKKVAKEFSYKRVIGFNNLHIVL